MGHFTLQFLDNGGRGSLPKESFKGSEPHPTMRTRHGNETGVDSFQMCVETDDLCSGQSQLGDTPTLDSMSSWRVSPSFPLRRRATTQLPLHQTTSSFASLRKLLLLALLVHGITIFIVCPWHRAYPSSHSRTRNTKQTWGGDSA